MSIRLIINELGDQSALVLEYHLSLAYSLIIQEFTLVDIAVAEIVGASTVSLVRSKVSFIEFTVLIL
jgi:hypothetical protein